MAKALAEFFRVNFDKHRDECAYRQRRGYRTESFTYGDIVRMSQSFANRLETRAICKGDRVMVWGENSGEWVAAFFGCVLRGAVVVPMDDGAAVDFAETVYKQVGAKLLVVSRAHADNWPPG